MSIEIVIDRKNFNFWLGTSESEAAASKKRMRNFYDFRLHKLGELDKKEP